jgi:ribosome-associated protein
MHDSPQPHDNPPTAPADPQRAGLPQRLRRDAVAQDPSTPATAIARSRPERQQSALQLATACARIADDNRGKDILLLDLRGATPLVDFFVIATAVSRRQASAIASEIDAEMKKAGEAKLGMEGVEEGRWILIDYGDFVVHVFAEDAREYYGLEDLWGDAERLEWSATPAPPA